MNWLRQLTPMFVLNDRPGEPPSEAEEEAFRLYLAALRRRLATIAAVSFVVLIVVFWPLDPVVFEPDVATDYARIRLAVVLALLIAIALLRFGPATPRFTEAMSGIYLVAFFALCTGFLAPLGLLGVQYLCVMPMAGIVLVLPERTRILVIAGIVVSTWGTVLAVSGGTLPPDTAGTLVTSIALAILAQVLGASLVGLLQAWHLNEQRLGLLTKALEGRVDEQARHLRALTRELLATRDTERRWLSQELHDALGQELTAMRHAGELAALQLQRGLVDDAEVAIEDVGTLVTRTHGTLRRILAHMRPEAVEQLGLAEAVRALADDVGRRGIQVSLRLDGALAATLPADVADALYRILQEALTNVARHSGARSVDVRLGPSEVGVLLQVQDDGVGLRSEPEMGVCHVGLIGISERARLCGGAATWTSPPTGGLSVRVEVPVTS